MEIVEQHSQLGQEGVKELTKKNKIVNIEGIGIEGSWLSRREKCFFTACTKKIKWKQDKLN